MVGRFTSDRNVDESESWWKKLWKVLNDGNSAAVEIGVSLFIILVVVIIIVLIVIRCKKKRKRPALPPVPKSKFFTDQPGFNISNKSDTLYEVIVDSLKIDGLTKDKQENVSIPDSKFLLHVTQAATSSSNSSNNEYSRDPTHILTSSGTSNDESQNPTPYVPNKLIFEFEHTNIPDDLKTKDPPKTFPQQEFKAVTLDRPVIKRKRRRGKQKSLDFHLSKTQADIYNFYLPMTANMSMSIDQILHKVPVRSEECLSEYVCHKEEPIMPVPIIIVTTPDQEKDLYLFKE